MTTSLKYGGLMLVLLSAAARGGEWSGHAAEQLRWFPSGPAWDEQYGEYLSLSFEPEYFCEWEELDQSITFRPFLRLDQHDPKRTHADIRELYWQKISEAWELRLGIRRVFWGCTESQHLVDIINQSDLVENPDGEDKLGQPMLNLTVVRAWGTFDLFLLPGFRERTFSGRHGRFRPPIPIDPSDSEYESGARESHLDWALRWFRSAGEWDVGLSHFAGTSREPRLETRFSLLEFPKLIPYYDQINQSGLDVQLTKGPALWKLETVYRSGQAADYLALTAGIEYTYHDVFKSGADVGIIAEYLYNSRGERAPTPFESDLFFGIRIGFNDVQSTEVLAGAIVDPGSGATVASLELSRRLGSDWRLNIEGRAFIGFPESDPGFAFHKDDYLQVELAWYF